MVIAHNRARAATVPRLATTATTGIRKFSVKSSLRAKVSAMNPAEKAKPPSSTLWVTCSTSSSASTPIPTSRPPRKPVAARPSQDRPNRCCPSPTSRSNVCSLSSWGTSGSAAVRCVIIED